MFLLYSRIGYYVSCEFRRMFLLSLEYILFEVRVKKKDYNDNWYVEKYLVWGVSVSLNEFFECGVKME